MVDQMNPYGEQSSLSTGSELGTTIICSIGLLKTPSS
jgi:hypothetical protein